MLPGLTPSRRAGGVADVRVGDVHGQVEAVAGLAPVYPVEPLWRAAVTLDQLVALGVFTQGNTVGLERLAVVDQLQLVRGLEHQDFFDGFTAQGLHRGGWRQCGE